MEHETFTSAEVIATVIGLLLTLSFGAWAAVVKKAADDMGEGVNRAITELSRLREEIHRDRVLNERRFARLEQHAGLFDTYESKGE